MHHALCCVASVSALPSWQWQRKIKNKFSSIHIQTVLHFHHGEFTGVEFTSNSSKTSQTSHKFHKHSPCPRSCCKTTCSFQKKCKRSLAEKVGFSLLLKNTSNSLSKTSCTSRKTKLHHKRPKFTCKCVACSKWISETTVEVLVHKRSHQKPLQHHAKSRKLPKTYRSQMLFYHSAANPELCTKKTLLSPNSSCHTKSCRKRSTCSPYQREFILPYPLLLRFPCSTAKKVHDMQHNAKICIHIIRKTIVRIRTRSHLFSAVPDVSKIPVYVNYSCVIAVVCVRILIDAEKLNSKCHAEITLQRIPCSPAHHKRSPIDSAQSIHTSEFQAHCTKRKALVSGMQGFIDLGHLTPLELTLVHVSSVQECINSAVHEKCTEIRTLRPGCGS